MESRQKNANLVHFCGCCGALIFIITFVTGITADVSAQVAATSIVPATDPRNTQTAPVSGPNVPEGFMDIKFGTHLEDAEKLLAARNYRFQKRKDWQQITLKNTPLAGLSAEEVKLSFSNEAGFYKGEARIKVDCNKSKTQGAEAFDKISRTINSKYRRFPKVDEKLNKDKRNYWTMEWEFRTKDNKQTAYEIKLYLQDDWKSKGNEWQKTSHIFITYLAPWAAPAGPTPPEPPSEGL